MVVNIDKFLTPDEIAGAAIATGPTSRQIELVGDISGITPPTGGTLTGGSINSQNYPDAAETGLQMEFKVPEDYDSGPLRLKLVYKMSTSVGSPNNQIRIETGAEIAKTDTGAIDTASYPLTGADRTVPDASTDVVEETFITISEGDFIPGDVILFFVKRLGAHGNDLHTGVWEVASFAVSYEGQLSTKLLTHYVEDFQDTDESFPPSGNKSAFETLDFETGVDEEQSFQWQIPEQWDGTSDILLRLVYAMSSAAAADVVLAVEGEVANVSSGAIDAIAPVSFTLTTTSDTDVHKTVVIFSVPASGRNVGDVLYLKLARRGTLGGDTHGGDLQLLSACIQTGAGSTAAFSTVEEFYLRDVFFNLVSGTIVESVETADLAGEFEIYNAMVSSTAAARANFEWQGKLTPSQNQITRIEIPIKGNVVTSEYQVKVYVEGQGATPVFDSGLTAASTSRDLVTINAGDLSDQPTGEGRFHVQVEATLDNTEELRVGSPYVRLE